MVEVGDGVFLWLKSGTEPARVSPTENFGCGYFISNTKEYYNRTICLFIDVGLFSVLNEAIRFDHLIKMHVPIPRSLLQSINGSLKLAHLGDRKSTRLNSSHSGESRMPSSA